MDNLALYLCLYIIIGLLAAWAAESYDKKYSVLKNTGVISLAVLLWPLMLLCGGIFLLVVVYQTIYDSIKYGRHK